MNSRKAYIIYILNTIVFIALEAVSIVMVSRHSIIQRSEIMKSILAVSNAITGVTGSIRGYFSLGRVNNALAVENVDLRIENDRLRAALELATGTDTLTDASPVFDYIPATIVSNSTDRLHNILIINKGRLDGIEEDMGVITGRGIVGYILCAGDRYSKVSSILDTDNMASAILKSSNTFGVLQWKGGNPGGITLHDIPVHTGVSEGDTVISSGYSLIYPPGIPIGTVEGMTVRDGINYDISVSLFEDFSKLRHVYVAVRKDMDQLQELIDGPEEAFL